MRFDELFEQRSLVAVKLKECIRDLGFTKVSFAKKAEISRPTLDRLLNSGIENKRSFDRHLKKILGLLKMSPEDLLFYTPMHTKQVEAVYSKNTPENHEMNSMARKQYELLLDVVDLCAIYY